MFNFFISHLDRLQFSIRKIPLSDLNVLQELAEITFKQTYSAYID